jgi:hypothetical protein
MFMTLPRTSVDENWLAFNYMVTIIINRDKEVAI